MSSIGDIEYTDHPGVSMLKNVAVEEPQTRVRQGELEGVGLAGGERRDLC